MYFQQQIEFGFIDLKGTEKYQKISLIKLSKKLNDAQWSFDESELYAQLQSSDSINIALYGKQGESICSSLIVDPGFI